MPAEAERDLDKDFIVAVDAADAEGEVFGKHGRLRPRWLLEAAVPDPTGYFCNCAVTVLPETD
jgi:hypothetical protein